MSRVGGCVCRAFLIGNERNNLQLHWSVAHLRGSLRGSRCPAVSFYPLGSRLEPDVQSLSLVASARLSEAPDGHASLSLKPFQRGPLCVAMKAVFLEK
jgi:hypothetical protein